MGRTRNYEGHWRVALFLCGEIKNSFLENDIVNIG